MDYYNILGVEKTASNEEIKKAYRKLAMQHHPDRGGDQNEFKKVNEAYSILSDEQKRKQYDRFGKVDGNNFGNGGFGGVDIDLGDIFENFFGGGFGGGNSSNRKRQNSSYFRGEDLEYLVNIDLKTSILGGKTKISYDKLFVCNDCNGEGGKGKKTCSDCRGSGYVKYRQQTIFGTIEHTGTCEKCNGSGEIIQEICQKCNGNKRIKKETEYSLEIPAGIDDGMVIKISGEGNDGIKGESGDLYVRFRISNNEKNITRKGVNLHYDLEIDVIEAILGTQKEVNIPIIGKRTIKIDSGTQIGTTIKIIGDGVKYIDKDKKGDLFVNIIIKIPKKLSEQERELYEQIAQEKKINVHNKKGIFEKIFG